MKKLLIIFTILSSIVMVKPVLASEANHIRIKHAYIKEMAPGQYSAAGYFKIKNTGNRPIDIVKISSPKAGKVQVHKMIYRHGMMQMRAIKHLRLSPHQVIYLEPGHKHLMLQQVNHRFRRGEKVKLKFHFNDLSQFTIKVPVKRI